MSTDVARDAWLAAENAATPSLDASIDGVVDRIRQLGSVLVALSGGVDSVLVAALAKQALGDRARAATVAAETLAGRELDAARHAAHEIGIEHDVLAHSELDNPEFVANPKHRCYVCQGMRMDLLLSHAAALDLAVVLDGTNASDPGPDRPGLAAITERGVHSPLLANGVDKTMARRLAKHLGLSAWDRPANACLSSRIPHGQVVTLGKLRRIERAEELLHARGFRVVRVRSEGAAARVELAAEDLGRARTTWQEIEQEIVHCGFQNVVLDERGYRSGGANASIAG